MKVLITTFFVGNLVDIVATLFFTGLGLPELNPIVAVLLNWPLVFVAVKLIIASVLSYILWIERADKLAIACAWVLALVYGAIAIYYLVGFALCVMC